MILADSIIKTLAYFDSFGIPLSDAEVRMFLYTQEEKGLDEIRQGLRQLKAQERVEQHEAFYSLPGRGRDFIRNRKMRQADAMHMLYRNRRWFSLLAAWPDVEAIAVCNNLAFLNAGPESDIDLFVIVKPGRLWITRFVLAGFLALTGKRPRPAREHNTICLSFLVASDALNLHSIAIPGEDIYLSYWLASLLPVYDPKNLLEQVRLQNQELIFSPGHLKQDMNDILWRAHTETLFWRLTRCKFSLLSKGLSPLASLLKRLQIRRFPESIKQAAAKHNRHVVISDAMLKFHTNDRREQYRRQWQERFNTLL